jgi:hypothetical protein
MSHNKYLVVLENNFYLELGKMYMYICLHSKQTFALQPLVYIILLQLNPFELF